MPNVLVVGATLQCSHGGVVRLTGGNAKLLVTNNAVITSGQEAGLSFAPGAPGVIVPCTHPNSKAPTPPPTVPCSATMAATSGISTLLVIDEMGALMDTASGQTVNLDDPQASWSVASAGQTVLSVKG